MERETREVNGDAIRLHAVEFDLVGRVRLGHDHADAGTPARKLVHVFNRHIGLHALVGVTLPSTGCWRKVARWNASSSPGQGRWAASPRLRWQGLTYRSCCSR